MSCSIKGLPHTVAAGSNFFGLGHAWMNLAALHNYDKCRSKFSEEERKNRFLCPIYWLKRSMP
uniref:Uncharacterized protein n=1 Tax=Octopus bimaculoides TaxID=37653 RepID=A0A0L8FFM1_OCTBM